MGFLRRFLGGKDEEDTEGSDEPIADDRQSVVAWVRLGDRNFENEREQQRLFELENRVMRTLEASGAGTYDTNDLAPGFYRMTMLGPDADRIAEVVTPLLRDTPPGSYLAIRRGPSGSSEDRVEIEPEGSGRR
jgi:hypothetical protein